jgi:hypothetical protein
LAEGTPFTFPQHPFGPHPWSGRARWTGTGLLQLHRPGDAHAVWAFWAEAERVATALDSGDRWWLSRWRNWRPAEFRDGR